MVTFTRSRQMCIEHRHGYDFISYYGNMGNTLSNLIDEYNNLHGSPFAWTRDFKHMINIDGTPDTCWVAKLPKKN